MQVRPLSQILQTTGSGDRRMDTSMSVEMQPARALWLCGRACVLTAAGRFRRQGRGNFNFLVRGQICRSPSNSPPSRCPPAAASIRAALLARSGDRSIHGFCGRRYCWRRGGGAVCSYLFPARSYLVPPSPPLLVDQVEPVEYRIKLTPDMEKFTCRGEQEVDVEVNTRKIIAWSVPSATIISNPHFALSHIAGPCCVSVPGTIILIRVLSDRHAKLEPQ